MSYIIRTSLNKLLGKHLWSTVQSPVGAINTKICNESSARRFLSSNPSAKLGLTQKEIAEFNLVRNIVKPWATKTPDRTALWLYDGKESTTRTYSELLNQSQHFANALAQMGSPKCALVILPKIAPWWIVNLAGSYTGMIISPGTPMLTEKEIEFRLEKCEADVIICSADLKEKYKNVCKKVPLKIVADKTKAIEEKHLGDGWMSFHEMVGKGSTMAQVECITDGDAIAQLFFTSGTTGTPKMVPHTQASYGIALSMICKEYLGLTEQDVFWNMSDLGWGKAAYSNLYSPLIAGSTVFVHQVARFDAKLTLQTLQNQPITSICFPPTAYRSIVKEDLHDFKTNHLTKCFSTGEALNPDVIDTWRHYTGITIQELYGQTETTIVATTPKGHPYKEGSFGKQVAGFNISILNEDLKEVAPMQEGQIAISAKRNEWPYGLCKEYYKDPEQTNKSFVGDFFLTGDKAYRDEEGYLYFVGRQDDIIISAGYRIGPFEVESALIEHPAVLESAAVASPDPQRGHVVKAFIVLRDQFNEASFDNQTKLKNEITAFVKQVISPYKCPKKIEFVDQLPKTISGKIRRVELREREFKNSGKD